MVARIVLLTALAVSAPGALSSPTPLVARNASDAALNPKCNINSSDPGTLWSQSGANTFLQNVLQSNNGQDNWINYMDKTYNPDVGTVGDLDCTAFPTGQQCLVPQVPCNDFTPPEQYYVRLSVGVFYEIMNMIYNGLDSWVSNDAFPVGSQTVYDDFGQPPDAEFHSGIFEGALGLAAAGLEAAGAITEALGPIGALFEGLSALFEVTDAAIPDQNASMDPTQPIKTELSKIWDTESANLKKRVDSILGNGTNQTTVMDVFTKGQFLVPSGSNATVQQMVNMALNQTEQSIMQKLAITTMKSNKYFVWVDTKSDQNFCYTITGTRWLNNQCYMLGSKGTPNSNSPVKPMDSSMVLHLDDPNKPYHFNVEMFYYNAGDCNAQNLEWVNTTAVYTPGDKNIYPSCFVDLPLLTAADTPCNDRTHNISALGFDDDFCKPQPVWSDPVP